MKKILLIILLFVSVKAFAQYPVPSGVTNFISTKIFYKISGSDTTVYMQSANGYWFPVGRKNNLVAKATDFEGAGTTSDKLGLRDTLLKSNWIIKSASTSLPGLTIDAENSDLTTPTITVFKFNGNRVSAIGSAGGYFGRGVFANSGGDYASVFTDTTGTLISRKKADSNPVLRLINLSSGSTGDFLFAGDSTSTKFRITRQGGIIAPLLTDTTGLTKSIVWNPSTGKFYTQTGGGGGTYTGSGGIGLVGSDFRLATGSTVGNVTIKPPDGTHNLTFASDGGSGSTASLLFFNDVLKLSFVESGGGNAYTTYSDFSGDAQLDQGYANGSTSKKVTFGSNYQGIRTTDNVDHIGLNGAEIFPLSLGTQYAQYHKVDSIAKAKADSVKGTITGGGTTTHPLTLGYGLTGTSFDGSTAVTTKVDTSVIQTILNLFPKTDTRYKHDFTIAGHSIASNFNTTLATLSYGYGIALQSGTASYDASGGSTFRVDTGATIQTVANFFPKGDTRYARTGSTGTVTSIATSTGITGGTITSTGTLKADTTVLQTVANFHPLGNTFWVPTARTVAGFPLSSNVTLAALTATDATLTFSGSYTGATARTVGLNSGNANTWTGIQTLNNSGSVASGIYNSVPILLNINNSGSGGYRGIYESVFEQANGSGIKYLIDLGTNSATNGSGTHTSFFSVTNAGVIQFGNSSNSATLASTASGGGGFGSISFGSASAGNMFISSAYGIDIGGGATVAPTSSDARINTRGQGSTTALNWNFRTSGGTSIFKGNDAGLWSLGNTAGTANQVPIVNSGGTAMTWAVPVLSANSAQATLVAGTKAITITGLTTSSKVIVSFVSIGGTVTTTWQYGAVCTANTLTLTALTNTGTTNTSDTSTLTYQVTSL